MRRPQLPTMAALLSVALLGIGTAAGGGGVALAAGSAPVASAQSAPAVNAGVSRPGDLRVLRAGHTSGGTAWQNISAGRATPRLRANSVATADIRVTYSSGFTPAAKAAFQAAVDIWKTQINSRVPITITADWSPLETDVLGQAGPANFRRDFTGAPQANTYYPDALANSLAGSDLDPAHPEIEAKFNSAFPAWYLGTDGRPDINHYDFESVVLHELGHGFGLVGTLDGLTPPLWGDSGRGYWGLDFTGDRPTIFDRLAIDGQGRDALNTSVYPQGSLQLGGLLRGNSGGLQWKGSEGVLANSGNRPRLYSPAGFQAGSSVSHLDEGTYPAGSANALMTPYLQNGESAHDPGPIVRGMFQDMGWAASTTCTRASGLTADRLVPVAATKRGTIAMTGGTTFDLPMAGRVGVPSTGVDAVLVTVEIPRPTASGWLMTGSGCGGATASAQQYEAGVSRSALVVVPLDSLGRMQLRLSGGSAAVSIYVHGWYAAGTNGGFTALPKQRINGAAGNLITAGHPVDVQATGVAGIAPNASSVVLNVTVVGPTAAGGLLVGAGGAGPTVVHQSYAAGRSISQLVVVKPSADGKVRLALSAGSARVYADTWGYYNSTSAGDVTHPVTPTRALSAATAPDVTFKVPGLPANAHSVMLVLTVTRPSANGFLGAAAGGTVAAALPGVVQYYAGSPIANLAVVPVGPNGTVRLKLSAGTGLLYADLVGYQAAS